jgi:hypothetical protein
MLSSLSLLGCVLLIWHAALAFVTVPVCILCHVISSPNVGVPQCSRIWSMSLYRRMLVPWVSSVRMQWWIHCMPAGFHVGSKWWHHNSSPATGCGGNASHWVWYR